MKSGSRVLLLAATLAWGVADGDIVLVQPTAGEVYARAGLEPGDVLTGWRLEDQAGGIVAEGEFASVFDAAVVSMEYAPRGRIIVAYRRDGVEHETPMPEVRAWVGELRPAWDAATDVAFLAALEQSADATREDDVAGLLALAAAGRDPLEAAWLLDQAAAALRRGGGLDAAQRITDQAIAAAERGKHPAAAAAIVRDAAIGLFQTGHPDEGYALFEENRRRQAQLDPRSLGFALALNNLAIAASHRSQFDTARGFAEQALALRQQLAPGSLVVAESLHTLGNAEFWTDNLNAAANYYARALEIRELRDPGGLTVARNLQVLSNVEWRRGRLREASDLLTRAADLYRANDANQGYVGELHLTLGHIATDRGHFAQAEQLYLQGVELFEEFAPNSKNHADALHALGIVSAARRDDEAAAYYERLALDIYEELQPEGQRVALVLTNLGRIALRRQAFDEAADYFRRSLAIVQAFGSEGYLLASRLSDLGNLERARGQAGAALAYYGRALSILESAAPGSLFMADALTDLGSLGRESSDPQAEAYLRRALTIATGSGPGTMFVARPAYELALLLRDSGESEPALVHFATAIDALEQQRRLIGGSDETRSRYGALHDHYYRDYIEMLVALGRVDDAFHAAERYRAHDLLMMMAGRDLSLDQSGLPAELLEERRRLNQDYGVAYEQYRSRVVEDGADLRPIIERLAVLRIERRELAERIRTISPLLAALENPQPIDAASASRAIEPGTLLLSFLVLDDRTLVFALTAGAARAAVFKAPVGAAQLADRVRRMRILLLVPDAGDESRRALDEIGAELAALLIEPALSSQPDVSRLLLLPDGPLHVLPFAALSRRTDDGPPRYLIEDFAIQSAASATVFAELRRRKASARPVRLAAFGDPDYTAGYGEPVLLRGRALGALPSSALEVRVIAQLYGKAGHAWVGRQATEEQVKLAAGDAGIVHLASHGVIDERSPLDSFVALSTPRTTDEENGLLQAWEVIEQLRLDAELVTLSACETALGETAGGEGMIGIARAFQLAGARSVMASLWEVPDRSTTALMARFYTHLRAGARRDDALRAAQLDLLRAPIHVPAASRSVTDRVRDALFSPPRIDASHPYYWAAFQLYGDAGSS